MRSLRCLQIIDSAYHDAGPPEEIVSYYSVHSVEEVAALCLPFLKSLFDWTQSQPYPLSKHQLILRLASAMIKADCRATTVVTMGGGTGDDGSY